MYLCTFSQYWLLAILTRSLCNDGDVACTYNSAVNVVPGVGGGAVRGTEGAGSGRGGGSGAAGAGGEVTPSGKWARESPYVASVPRAPGEVFQIKASR